VSKLAETVAEAVTSGASGAELARAKINLALHVTGRRTDGYHLISSLVVFADVADVVSAAPAPGGRMGLTVDGPLASELVETTEPRDNLVVRAAARLVRANPGRTLPPTRVVLTKRLPLAAGLGGGSADAAATLRLLDRYWRLDSGQARLAEIGIGLGADVPMCLRSRPLVAEGIGERLTPAVGIPALPIVLAHPGVASPTAAVFGRLEEAERTPLPKVPSRFASVLDFVMWLRRTRNDLTEPAKAENRVVGTALKALGNDSECLFARMTGSGAAVFGIFITLAAATHAAERLRAARPAWWVAATLTGGS
jgi:4-diphosphocytidyl-2-C-methyl-D-erythritol kinase